MKFTSSFDNYGLRLAGTLTTKDDHSTFYENYKRVVPQIDGFYVFEKHVSHKLCLSCLFFIYHYFHHILYDNTGRC